MPTHTRLTPGQPWTCKRVNQGYVDSLGPFWTPLLFTSQPRTGLPPPWPCACRATGLSCLPAAKDYNCNYNSTDSATDLGHHPLLQINWAPQTQQPSCQSSSSLSLAEPLYWPSWRRWKERRAVTSLNPIVLEVNVFRHKHLWDWYIIFVNFQSVKMVVLSVLFNFIAPFEGKEFVDILTLPWSEITPIVCKSFYIHGLIWSWLLSKRDRTTILSPISKIKKMKIREVK